MSDTLAIATPAAGPQQSSPDDVLAGIAQRRGVPLPVLKQTWVGESGGRTAGVPAGDGGQSIGPFQIKLPALAFANHAAGTNYTPADLNDFNKAADVASIILAANQKQFGNWPAATAAYMTGPKGLEDGNVNRDVINRATAVSQALGLPSDITDVTTALGVPNAYGFMPVRPDYSNVDPLIQRIEGNQAALEAATAPMMKGIVEGYEKDRARADKAFDAIEPVNVKLWTAKPPDADPVEGFASAGAIFAGIASAFTHTPAINAMNGMAAAINARHKNDEEAYKQAYDAWKSNTQLAIDRQKIQSDAFKDALELMKSNLSEGVAAMKVAASIYGSKDAMLWAEAGLYERIAQQNAVADRAALQMQMRMDQIERGRFDKPVIVQTQDEQGNPQYTLAQQDKLNGGWVTADEKREPIQGVMGTMKADQIPPANDPSVQRTAEAIANYQLAPLSGFVMKTPWGQAVMSRVLVANPDYHAQTYNSMNAAQRTFAAGQEGRQVRSMNVAIAHLDTFEELAKALHNGDVQAINRVAQRIATETGQPAPTNFDLAKQIIGEEIVKAVVAGGGGVTERMELASRLSRANSPAQLAGVVETARTLLAGQLSGLKTQYEGSTKQSDFDEKFLTPRSRELLEHKAGEASKARGGGDVPRPKTKAEYDALPSGTRFVAPDGSERVKP